MRYLLAVALVSSMVYLPANAATVQSQSIINDCSIFVFSSSDLHTRSAVINGNFGGYRARALSTHQKLANNIWSTLDFVNKFSSGLTAFTAVHSHGPGNANKFRVLGDHIYEKCGTGFWEDWVNESTDQIGCGNNEA